MFQRRCGPTWVDARLSNSGGRRWRRRLAALGVGLGLLLALELFLRLLGVGAPGHRPDPFAGFSGSDSLFVKAESQEGTVWRIRPEREGSFNPQEFPAAKADNVIRLFCLGGSSTFGFPYSHEISFCAAIERGLAQQHPDKEFQVINTGGMSYGSHRVLQIMRELGRYEADGFIVYMGHNEYVERRFYAPFLQEPVWRRHVRVTANRSRLYRVMKQTLRPLAAAPQEADNDLFGTGPVRDDSRRQARNAAEDALIAEHFRFVLDEMNGLATSLGVPLFLVQPATNLADWAPEGSFWSADLTAAEIKDRDARLADARRLAAAGESVAALDAIDESLAIDPAPAASHFLRGRILLKIDPVLAQQAFRQARDRDAVPIRLTSPLEAEIHQAWDRHRLRPLDADAHLSRLSPDGIVGDEMVMDYCHPSPAAHRHIAAMLLPSLADALWPGTAPEAMDPDDLRPASGEGAAALTSAFGAAWAGQMKIRQGDLDGAALLFRRALSLNPGLATAHEGLGRVLAQSGQIEEAIRELQEATRLAPEESTGWNNLGQALRSAGRHQEALAAYDQALAAGRGSGIIHRNRAATLLALDRHEESRNAALAATAASPADALSWVQLGKVLQSLGEEEEARRAYRRALELDPAAPGAAAALGKRPPALR